MLLEEKFTPVAPSGVYFFICTIYIEKFQFSIKQIQKMCVENVKSVCLIYF